ncbi:MAG: hypothetical protein IPL28_26125 [Chloroflexi bacterium]|nr:hypothetical protein [Chloroflexota bacterium]
MNDLTPKKSSETYYQAYLVRLWRDEASAPWRVTVTYVRTGEQHHFPTIAAYLAFMEERAVRHKLL